MPWGPTYSAFSAGLPPDFTPPLLYAGRFCTDSPFVVQKISHCYYLTLTCFVFCFFFVCWVFLWFFFTLVFFVFFPPPVTSSSESFPKKQARSTYLLYTSHLFIYSFSFFHCSPRQRLPLHVSSMHSQGGTFGLVPPVRSKVESPCYYYHSSKYDFTSQFPFNPVPPSPLYVRRYALHYVM